MLTVFFFGKLSNFVADFKYGTETMIRLERLKTWFLIAVLTISGARPLVALPLQRTASFASCTSKEDNATGQGKVAEIVERGTILFGTTGDYRPLSFCEPDGTYWGFGIDVANEIARRLGVDIEFKKTSWPTLTADVLTEPQIFDLAIGGIICIGSLRAKRKSSSAAND